MTKGTRGVAWPMVCAVALAAAGAHAQTSSAPTLSGSPPGAITRPLPSDGGRPEPSRKRPGPLYIPEQPGTALLGSEYLRRPVYGSDKQQVGFISDLLVDISGHVTGFVLQVSDVVGVDGKEVAISFEGLIPVRENDRELFLVEVSKAQLASAPPFKRAN